MYRFIHDANEVEDFANLIWNKNRKQGEVFFMSLSARNKYLTEEERLEIKLPGQEMFERKIVRSPERLLSSVHRYESEDGSYLTKYGNIIPQKCMVVYANINPTNVIKAFSEIQQTMNNYFVELTSHGINSNSDKIKETLERMTNMDRVFLNAYQTNVGTRNWIDVDMDSKNDFILSFIQEKMKASKVKYATIETRGGYHILLDKETVKFNFNLVIEEAQKKLIDIGDNGECIVNTNNMVPLPGTIQAGFKVRFIRDRYTNDILGV